MSKTRILIIEDEPAIAEGIAYNLRRDGYEVARASDGEAGLAEARRVRPPLVLLDLMLPGLSGIEVCQALRRESSVPVIMLTARDTETDKVVGLTVGADDYITIFTVSREYLVSIRLSDLETHLAQANFLRVHRSHLVNLDYVTSIEPYDATRLQVSLKSGAQIVASRAGTKRLRELAL